MAFVHERLYQSEGLSNINVEEFVSDLVSHLFSMYEGSTSAIHIQMEVPEIHLDLDVAIPTGLMINELVSNVMKHAFPPEQGAGEIRVALGPLENGDLELLVGDNGVGLPEELDPDATMSLGLRLVALLTEQLQGTLVLERDGGTTFKITIPGEIWSPPEPIRKSSSPRLGGRRPPSGTGAMSEFSDRLLEDAGPK
jgi:two-component sensor histidine kinase